MVFWCEMHGIEQTAEIVMQIEIIGGDICILTDNQACLNGIDNNKSKQKVTMNSNQH